MDTQELSFFYSLAISLAIGLLIGSERGWHTRAQEEGTRVAGIRTFTLISALGGVTAFVSQRVLPEWSLLICALVFIPLTLLLIAGYVQSSRSLAVLSITTEVAAMLTFWLGALPAYGFGLAATATAVILALVLHMKNQLHHWLRVIDEQEMLGTLQFLIVSVVLLPLLPNQGYGPWQAINPYELWWMVVLISGLSLLGYFATRLVGTRRGILATSLAGGLVSSTSVTLTLSKLHRDVPDSGGITAGILLAWATMFARIVIVVTALRPSLVPDIMVPMALAFFGLLGVALWHFRTSVGESGAQNSVVRNPFQLIPALQFAALLGAVMLAGHALEYWLGDAGLYLLSVVAGIADVDAIVLSLSPQAGAELSELVVVTCITLAAASNTIIKGIYCRVIAGPVLGKTVLLTALLTAGLVLLYPAAMWVRELG